MRALIAVVLVGAVAAVAAAGSGASRSIARCGKAPAHENVRGVARGDVDGDGRPDHVEVATRFARPSGCRFLLRIRLATGRALQVRLRDPLGDANRQALRDLPWPRLYGLAHIDAYPGAEALVPINQGAASTTFAAYSVDGEGIHRLDDRGALIWVDAGMLSDTTDCVGAQGAGLLVHTHVERSINGIRATRERFRVVRGRFVRVGRPVRIGPKLLAALPEFGPNHAAFGACGLVLAHPPR